MKIIKLTAENIKRLVAVEITPDGSLVKITGKNGAGKTSVLDSIEWALAGTESITSQPIRRGAKKGTIEIDLGEMVVHRTITHSGSQLFVQSKDGSKLASPQTLLNSLLGKLSFDPLEFMRLRPSDQFATLRRLVGIDTADVEAKQKAEFDKRTQTNRDLKNATARFDSIEVAADAPDEEINSADIGARIQAGNELNRKNENARQTLQAIKSARDTVQSRLAELRSEIKRYEDENLELESRIATGEKHCAELVDADVSELQRELAGVDQKNRAARAKKEKRQLQREVESLTRDSRDSTRKIELLEEEKTKRTMEFRSERNWSCSMSFRWTKRRVPSSLEYRWRLRWLLIRSSASSGYPTDRFWIRTVCR